MAEWVGIANDRLSAAINPIGAELSSLRDAQGRELMTDADPRWWTGRAPILFPVVGKPAGEVIRVDGRRYPMKQHGFARRMMFTPTERSEAHLILRLTDSAETRKHYPFPFVLDVAFRLDGATLLTEVTLVNTGTEPLPASFGFHPAFAWPLPYGRDRADHRIAFAAEEPDALRAIADDGTIADGTRPSPLEGRTLHLRDDLFEADALVWDHVRSDSVTYGASDGPQLRIDFPDTPMLGIWTRPGAHYVCVEPWHGIADPHGYTGEFRDKPGVFEVAPGGANRIAMSVTVTG